MLSHEPSERKSKRDEEEGQAIRVEYVGLSRAGE